MAGAEKYRVIVKECLEVLPVCLLVIVSAIDGAVTAMQSVFEGVNGQFLLFREQALEVCVLEPFFKLVDLRLEF